LILFSSQIVAKIQQDMENDAFSRFWYSKPWNRLMLTQRGVLVWGVLLMILGITFVLLGATGKHL
jgi:hypothetical protein